MAPRPTRSGAVRLALAAGLALAVPAAATADVPAQTGIINELLAKSWEAAELKPSKKCSDHEFIRRVFIDLIGRIPMPEEVVDFVDRDKSPGKRAALVNRLLNEKAYQPAMASGKKFPDPAAPKDPKAVLTLDYVNEFAENWANIWSVWLMTRSGVNEVYHEQMRLWLIDQFSKADYSHKDMVQKLITATGKTNENGAVAFVMAHVGDRIPNDKVATEGKFDDIPITSRTTRLFLGLQTQCVQCHDHPFNPEWKQEHFWGVNAFFRQTDREGTPPPRTGLVKAKKAMVAGPITLVDSPDLNKSERIFYERRSGVLMSTKATFLPNMADLEKESGVAKKLYVASGGKTRRQALADYVVSHDNFAKAFVNRTWGHLFGRGLHEQPAVDDFGSHNKCVHPELLDKLAAGFIDYGYKPKVLLEWICNSDAYQLSYQANGLADGKGGNAKHEADPYFTRMALKSMSPEVLFDSLMTATRAEAAATKEAKEELRARWMSRLVVNFGDDEGNEMTFNGTIIQALVMMNGADINSAIAGKEAVAKGDTTGQSKWESAVDKAMKRNGGAKGGIDEASAHKVIDDLYLTALARKPGTAATISTPQIDPKTRKEKVDSKGKPLYTAPISEQAFLKQQLAEVAAKAKADKDPHAVYKHFFEDLFWSLLNTNEFILNH